MIATPSWLDPLKALLPEEIICNNQQETEKKLIDWRGRFHGNCALHLCPDSIDQVSTLMAFCHHHHIPVVPQGGNTGLSGGATPDSQGNSILVSFERMNKIRHCDQKGGYLIAEAGCRLQEIQDYATQNHLFFPLNLASASQCTLGGNLATNAGGSRVLRYGNCRNLTLGIEAVLPDGTKINDLSPLKKDNSGYDIKNLLIGSEGTLAIITAASLTLFPEQNSKALALIGVDELDVALDLFYQCRHHFNEWLSAFELIPWRLLGPAIKITGKTSPFPDPKKWVVMIEITSSEQENHIMQKKLEQVILKILGDHKARNVVFANNLEQYHFFWRLRETMIVAQKDIGYSIKHDIALPIASIVDFIDVMDKKISTLAPMAEPCPFGHLGDGNIHYNVFLPDGHPQDQLVEKINRAVYDQVDAFGGTISAEHGIGQLKRDLLPLYKDEGLIKMMRCIKQAVDPNNIMNPGKLL